MCEVGVFHGRCVVSVDKGDAVSLIEQAVDEASLSG